MQTKPVTCGAQGWLWSGGGGEGLRAGVGGDELAVLHHERRRQRAPRPLSGQQRNDQFVSGEFAWNQTGATATPGPRFVTERVHQLWITPHGALKAALWAHGRNPGLYSMADVLGLGEG